DSVHEYTWLYGPNGIIPNDTWTMRRFAVMERTPLTARHPYKSVVEDWDSQNYDAWTMESFDHKDKLWKIWESRRSGARTSTQKAGSMRSTKAPTQLSSSRCRCSTSRTIAAPSGSFPADSRT